jgi:GNAT superfamily N-acetyltransferase
MVITKPPPKGPDDVVARQVETYDERVAAAEVSAEAFGTEPEMRAAFLARAERVWPYEQTGGPMATFIATIHGEPVGFGNATFGPHAVFLNGGGTRPEFRGAGVYRALIRARWDAAVARGTPALTVGAGRMSQPALERLGFQVVGWYDVLLDDLE